MRLTSSCASGLLVEWSFMSASVPPDANPTPNLAEAIQKLLTERKDFEQYLQENYEALNSLREQIRGEKATAQAELEKQRLDFDASAEKAELIALRELTQGFQKQLQEFERRQAATVAYLKSQVDQVQFERDSLRGELQQLHHQLEQKQAADGTFEQLLRQLQDEAIQQQALASEKTRLEVECGAMSVELQNVRAELAAEKARFEQERQALTAVPQAMAAEKARFEKDLAAEKARFEKELQAARAQAGKTGDLGAREKQLEDGWKEFEEKLAMLEQYEADLRRQQEALTHEKEAPPRAPVPAPAPAPAVPVPLKAALPDPVPLMGQRMLTFNCKYCSKQLQVKERLAGLMTKCSGCAKMVPIPKLTG
jgi:chromosome segregation ATPase